MNGPFPALVLRQDEAGAIRAGFEELTLSDLPAGEVLVEVSHSSVNYKDGLAVTGKGRIARTFPLIAGIDLAGTVVASDAPEWSEGDVVLATGWGLGEERAGGYARYARLATTQLTAIPKAWAPDGPALAMGLGTAGFTAMLAVLTLEERGILPEDGPIIVTGASGGVGGIAVALLVKSGYEVAAVTGRMDNEAYLRALGASQVLPRAEFDRDSRPLESDRWAGGVDTVGGRSLATLAAQVRRGGGISVCGNAGGAELVTTVFPFILRGVALLGIDSNYCPRLKRRMIWERLAKVMSPKEIRAFTETIPFSAVPEAAARIVAGQVRGRLVVTV